MTEGTAATTMETRVSAPTQTPAGVPPGPPRRVHTLQDISDIHSVVPKQTQDLQRDGDRLLGKEFYQGAFSADHLPTQVPANRAWGLIVNNQPGHLPGEHWVAIYGSPEGEVHLFDTAGRHPSTIYRPWVRWMVNRMRKAPLLYNKHKVQTPTSPVCGHHCLHYLWLRKKDSMKSPLYACKGRTISDTRIAQRWNDRAVLKWALDHKVPVMIRDS